jgi:hypothetical protein
VPADAGRLQRVSPTLVVAVYKAAVTAVHAAGDEYVTVTNTGTVPLNLQGWRLTTAAGSSVPLPSKALARGISVRVHTGTGTDRPGDLYLRSTALLGDLHDTVRLLDATGFQVSRRTY